MTSVIAYAQEKALYAETEVENNYRSRNTIVFSTPECTSPHWAFSFSFDPI